MNSPKLFTLLPHHEFQLEHEPPHPQESLARNTHELFPPHELWPHDEEACFAARSPRRSLVETALLLRPLVVLSNAFLELDVLLTPFVEPTALEADLGSYSHIGFLGVLLLDGDTESTSALLPVSGFLPVKPSIPRGDGVPLPATSSLSPPRSKSPNCFFPMKLPRSDGAGMEMTGLERSLDLPPTVDDLPDCDGLMLIVLGPVGRPLDIDGEFVMGLRPDGETDFEGAADLPAFGIGLLAEGAERVGV